jgi:hypothetical protein
MNSKIIEGLSLFRTHITWFSFHRWHSYWCILENSKYLLSHRILKFKLIQVVANVASKSFWLISVLYRSYLFLSLRKAIKCQRITPNPSMMHLRYFSMLECTNMLKLFLIFIVYLLFSSMIKFPILLKFLCRYDINTKELKHMKPLPENFLKSLNENLDFLGPYPWIIEFVTIFTIITFLKSSIFVTLLNLYLLHLLNTNCNHVYLEFWIFNLIWHLHLDYDPVSIIII